MSTYLASLGRFGTHSLLHSSDTLDLTYIGWSIQGWGGKTRSVESDTPRVSADLDDNLAGVAGVEKREC